MALSSGARAEGQIQDAIALKLLGKNVFFDKRLSSPSGMGCVSCHEPTKGGTFPGLETNLHQVAITGADITQVGRRRPQTNTYASFSPPFFADCPDGIPGFCGGNFWDGRAQGRPPATDGTLPVPPLAAPHLDSEVFFDIVNPNVLSYSQYISPISDQALNPFIEHTEQNLPSRAALCDLVASADYAWLFQLAWGEAINCGSGTATGSDSFADISYKRIAMAVGAYQHSPDINRFDSKRDIAIRSELACIDQQYSSYYNPTVCFKVRRMRYTNPDKEYGKFPLVSFTDQENLGHDLFYNVDLPFIPGDQRANKNLPAAQCSFCHSDHPATDDGSEPLQIYADQAYHNLGVPPNPQIPKLTGLDTGLILHLGSALFPVPDGDLEDGFFRTPTIRNTGKGAGNGFVKAYMHNGYFKSLASVVHFYNTRSVLPDCEDLIGQPDGIPPGTPLTEEVALAHNCWPIAEFPVNQTITGLVGGLNMTANQEAALVAYMQTLSDQGSARPPVLVDGTQEEKGLIMDLYSHLCPEEVEFVTSPSPGYYDRTAFHGCVTLLDLVEAMGEDDWVMGPESF
ncbi:cytochrome c peroxidase [Microbulbifer sp. SAOS-129_SWC]|uniref:cytochrome-c peroxidase n=1 Tax=Microbulbifer sp. SAOS-129_SWC TaxID=3145235 RepID=UPI0032165C4A